MAKSAITDYGWDRMDADGKIRSNGGQYRVACGPIGAFVHKNSGFNAVDLCPDGVRFLRPSAGPWVLSYEKIGDTRIVPDTLWDRLEIDFPGNVMRMYGFPKGSLRQIVGEIDARTAAHRERRARERLEANERERQRAAAQRQEADRRKRARYDDRKQVVLDAKREADALFDGSHYVRFADAAAWDRKYGHIRPTLDALPAGLLTYDEIVLHDALRPLLPGSAAARERANEAFIARECERWQALFDRHGLTDAQRRACVVDEVRQRILAGAGTGKTRTMVAKAAYLVESGKARPEEIIALSYGGVPAAELRGRLDAAGLGGVEATTIHALGLSVLGVAEGRPPSVSPLVEKKNATRLLAAIQDYVADLTEDPAASADVTRFIAQHSDAERDPSTFASYDQYLDYVRNCELLTLQGENVKSFAECDIANFLWLNRVPYRYEGPYEHDVATAERKQYEPDFYLSEHGIYIEHFGVDRTGATAPGIDRERYAEDMEWKRALHAERGTTLVETHSWMRSEGSLLSNLRDQLVAKRVELRPRRPDEIFDAANRKVLTRLAAMLRDFIPPFKESERDIDDLRPAATDPDPNRTRLFFRVFASVYARYEEGLRAQRHIDYADMIVAAARALRDGKGVPAFRYILVDEFQDVSPGRGKFLRALVDACGAALCVVGDDWQAIYNFAGCDGALFTEFGEHFGAAETSVLDETFRFNDVILRVSSAFVQTNPNQLRKELRTARAVQGPAVVLVEASRETAPDAALAWLTRNGSTDGSAYLLARTNSVLERVPLDDLRARFPRFDINGLTAHGAKGSEADVVVVLNASDARDGFPSQVETDPILRAALPEVDAFPDAEERRLFYVALTRAHDRVVVCFDRGEPSAFVRELAANPDVVSVTVDGRPLMSRKVVCRTCLAGHYVRRENASTTTTFYACSSRSCKETSRACPTCSGVLDVDGNEWVCVRIGCDYRCARCPACRRGYLRRIEAKPGKYGAFVACSLGRKADPYSCQYKRDLAR